MKISGLSILLIMLNALLLSPAEAQNGSADMTMHGTLVAPPPCKVNEGQNIDIDFGDVGINKIDGNNYRKGLNYTITCDPSSGSWNMYLMMTGVPVNFDSDGATINSNINGLGVKIWIGNNPFTLNTLIPVSPTNLPVLEAVPIKDTAATLNEGAFQAVATLVAIYQ